MERNCYFVFETQEYLRMSVMVGKEAPQFTADALDQGRTRKVSLSEYRGRWVLLFFYPADLSTV
jgi:peroxiredoxin (alkyl hydroperoxide reductase subunit C)